jgi:16S rRNA (guanine966-N2)-methyltransferase
MTRVIAGTFGGRRLKTPPGSATRPTSDRVREALFSSLAGQLEGARVADLFAGSGALGIEALSRGAATAALIEPDRRAAAVIRANLAALGLGPETATVHEMSAEAFSRQPAGGPFDVVLLDSPYAVTLATLYRLLAALQAAGSVAAPAVVVVERDRRDADLNIEPPPFLSRLKQRTYGDTVLLYLHTGDHLDDQVHDKEPAP